MNKDNNIKKHTKDKEEKHMAVSMAIVPLLKDDAAISFKRCLQGASIKPYSEVQRKETTDKIAEIIEKRQKR